MHVTVGFEVKKLVCTQNLFPRDCRESRKMALNAWKHTFGRLYNVYRYISCRFCFSDVNERDCTEIKVTISHHCILLFLTEGHQVDY
jgi:hypothetical protein